MRRKALTMTQGASTPSRLRLVVTTSILVLCSLSLCQCYVYNAHKTIKEVRQEIDKDEGVPMDAAAKYHMDAAKGLLVAAEKQYEDADFTEATSLARQAQDQVDRSRKLRSFHDLFSSDTLGGTN